MSKKEFLSKLKVKLTKYEDKGVEKVIQFYTEIIDDKLEMGMTEREAVDSLGEMDDIVESLMIDLVERTDKPSEKQETAYRKDEYIKPARQEPTYYKDEYVKPEPVYEKSSRDSSAKVENEQPKAKQKVGYDIFHDYDLIGKKGYKLNKALNTRFNCGYQFTIYSLLHYLAIVAKVIFGLSMSIAAGSVVAGGIMFGISYADSLGKIMFVGGAILLAASIIMVVCMVGIKIIGLVQEIFHNIMRKTIDKKIVEVNYEIKY